MLHLYLVRHGETDYNQFQHLIGGRSNHLEMNETGIRQCHQLGAWMQRRQLQFDHIFCSTAKRTKQTLAILNEYLTETRLDYSPELEELSQGDWEGQPRSLLYTPEQLAIINSNNYRFKAPNGESQEEVENRMYGFIANNLLPTYKTGHFLIVSHGMAIKCLLRKILDARPEMTYKILISNTGICRLRFDHSQGWWLDALNETGHLNAEQL